MIGEYVVIHTMFGYKFIGKIKDVNKSSLFKIQWISIITKKGEILLNLDHVISIQYGKSRTGRRES